MKFGNIKVGANSKKQHQLKDVELELYYKILVETINSLKFNMIKENSISLKYMKDTLDNNYYSQDVIYPYKSMDKIDDIHKYRMQIGILSMSNVDKNIHVEAGSNITNDIEQYTFLYFLISPIGFAYAISADTEIYLDDLIWITQYDLSNFYKKEYNDTSAQETAKKFKHIEDATIKKIFNHLNLNEKFIEEANSQIKFIESQFDTRKNKLLKLDEKDLLEAEEIRKVLFD